MEHNFHEEFCHDAPIKEVTERQFGMVGGSILCAIGAFKLLFGGWTGAFVFITMGLLVLLMAFVKPDLITKPKILLMKAAPVIARVMNPILMGLIFALCFVPGGIIMKILRRDLLNRDYDPYAASYWTKRAKHDLPNPMKYQF